MLTRLFGLLLVIGVLVVGVKACDPDFSKTKHVLVSVPRLAPMPTCIQFCLRHDPTDECVQACAIAHPPKSAARDEFQRRVQAAQAAAVAVVNLRVNPCPPPVIQQVAVKKHYSKKTFSKTKPTVNAAKAKRTVAVKKHYSKTKHVYKFVVSHHHKSKVSPPFKAKPKPHHHHGGHHHHSGGHHHSGPQKIPAHGPPSHLTGCGP